MMSGVSVLYLTSLLMGIFMGIFTNRTLMFSSRPAVVVAPMAPRRLVRTPLVNPVLTVNPAVVAQLSSAGTNTQVADNALTVWRDIDNHLSPIVGAGGVAALYKRSLYLTSKDYPCLRRPLALFKPAEYHLLYLVLIAQERAEAIAVNGAMLRTFSGLLASLIGVSLSQRLLQSVLDHPSSGRDPHFHC